MKQTKPSKQSIKQKKESKELLQSIQNIYENQKQHMKDNQAKKEELRMKLSLSIPLLSEEFALKIIISRIYPKLGGECEQA